MLISTLTNPHLCRSGCRRASSAGEVASNKPLSLQPKISRVRAPSGITPHNSRGMRALTAPHDTQKGGGGPPPAERGTEEGAPPANGAATTPTRRRGPCHSKAKQDPPSANGASSGDPHRWGRCISTHTRETHLPRKRGQAVVEQSGREGTLPNTPVSLSTPQETIAERPMEPSKQHPSKSIQAQEQSDAQSHGKPRPLCKQ